MTGPGSIRSKLAGTVAAVGIATAAILLGAGLWIPAKAELAQHLLERAWKLERGGAIDVRPWPWADTSPLARLSIPELGSSWIVLSGASGRNLAFAPAHVDGSASPGSPGVMLVAGHRDTHFRVLERIETGVELKLEDTEGQVYWYRVNRVEIVDATHSRIRLDRDQPTLVLTTCYPFDALSPGGPLRLVVTAESIEHGSRAGPRLVPGAGTVTQFMGHSSASL